MIRPNLEMDFCYSVFDSVSDNQPKPRTDCFTAFRSRFDRFQLLQRKEKGKLFSPARFTPGTTRKSENVVDVCAMVLDFDNGVDPSDFIDDWKEKQLAFWWHTTFNHTPEKPKWRAIFPLATPIPAYQWARAWEAASEYLGHGQNDVSAKNADRIYYMPSRPVEGDKHLFHSEANEGYLLDPSFLLRSDEKPPEGKGRVGDDFELRATISEILEPHGWIFSRKVGQLEYWARPGKQKGEISATWGWRSEVQGERFYCFSDNAGIPCRNYLTKFALYTMLNHGGDWKASTVSLSKQGYGIQVVAGGTSSPSSSPVSSPQAAVMSENIEDSEFTEQANADRLIEQYGQDLRYVAELKQWAVWNGKFWDIGSKEASESKVIQMAVASARDLQRQSGLADKNTAPKMLKWAIKSQNARELGNTVKLARTLVTTLAEEFDQQPEFLNCQNGIVDLRTGEMLPHDRSMMFTQITRCAADLENVRPELFNQFIERVIPDEDTRKYLLQFLGYMLSGSVAEQCYVFFFGATGNNGKSTLTELISWILGEYAVTIETEALMLKKFGKSNEGELAQLRGRRLAVAHEVSDSQRLDEELIKRLTGGDIIRARQLYQDPLNFRPTAKLLMTGNNKPQLRSMDSATWRRIRLIPFEVTVPAEERDAKLYMKLRAEAPKILGQLIKCGIHAANHGMEPSKLMVKHQEEYKEENDFLADFFNERCLFMPNLDATAGELHAEYNSWARETSGHIFNRTAFGRILGSRLTALGISKRKDGHGIIRYYGICLKN
jgi:P4 family phage/plasmid primase-like protien